jgi:hypothetical protein
MFDDCDAIREATDPEVWVPDEEMVEDSSYGNSNLQDVVTSFLLHSPKFYTP